ncbi:DUF3396 domain-containing protein [Pseudomonas otitidis]|uniref:DUF3396 domain-containing protein n=1 Tax=Metapseudomonas otitidis TaxID=319939 RepID=UPI002446D661|nr:DUF3396 domain-containing protein [Pseudomonas otitidis]MDH1109783.1 DUF3396 domain-containing protein [Pseudomonas otitidis]MDH1162081.1 DUF3396 domain-containing protein [Pseudomonas otitidis]MDH1167717.1 DUF3396 domain-containing protein [Pseudomonas otitidis]
MNALETLKQHAPELEIENAQGQPVVKLGLIATLYFREGYTAERKQRVVECFERFYEAFADTLKWQVGERFQKLTPERFDKKRQAVLTSGPNEQQEWHLSSAKNEKEARDYSLQFLNSFEAHGEQRRSYIKLILPWTLLSEPEGPQRYQEWLTYLCNQVQAEHGYGGLSCVLPYDYDSYMPSEYQLAQRYSGLEVDTLAYAMCRRLQNHIKGANWYTVLGQSYVERLGGEERLRHALSGHGVIVLLPYEQGLIIRAGDCPELGAQADGLPRAYVAVSNVVKPVRLQETGSLHTYSPYGNCFDEASTQRWYQRFDLDPNPATPPRTEGGQRCPRAGYWFTPAQTNSLRRFAEGELMPVIEQSSWGHTFWYWSTEG